MKVGTDGVLLGAWTSVENEPKNILDIGAGTGLIALMLAQRSSAEMIDAVEIEAGAYEQCVENFEASAWGDRLFCYHASLAEFVEELEEQYDLIVSNPPFYAEEQSGKDPIRDRARQNQFLPFEELLRGVSILLSTQGCFTTIIPYNEEKAFVKLAVEKGLYPHRITRVKGNPKVAAKRSLLAFGRDEQAVVYSELVIEIGRHEFTQEYRSLTQDFYLKM
ncbi:MAG: tRNA1(Val) (adenine(37)-N6)-methyltransferase [Flavobacteriaceae bacterium]